MVQRDFSAKGLVHHNWSHIQRDLATAVILGEAEKADMKIVLASVLLHDIGRLYPELGDNHHKAGAKVAVKYLKRAGFSGRETEAVIHCIRSHSPRGLEEPKSLEAKVVYDVDVLSCSVGYLGVARVFSYFMREEGLGVKEMMTLPSGKSGPREDFYTETGRRLGEEGLQKAWRFWEELREELKKEDEKLEKSFLIMRKARDTVTQNV
jgi:uncharacterized protein